MTQQKLTPEQKQFMLFAALNSIPTGCVITYGELAQLAGLGRAARWVGTTLSKLPSDTKLPWHRVIAAGGRISLPELSASGRLQRERLQAEGIEVHNQRVSLARYGWTGAGSN